MPFAMLGHFQPFHKGHAELLIYLSKLDEVYVYPIIFERRDGKELLTRKNPFSYEQRKAMIRNVSKYCEREVIVRPDYKIKEPYLANYLKVPQLLGKFAAKCKIVTRDVGEAWITALLTTPFKVKLLPRTGPSGKEVRRLIFKEVLEGKKTDWREYVMPEDNVKLVESLFPYLRKVWESNLDLASLFGLKFPLYV